MITKIYCKTTAKGQQTFYLLHNNKLYYLFNQSYKVSNKTYFQNGLSISEIFDFSRTKSHSVRQTLEKLQRFISYIEREFDICITKKSQKKNFLNYKLKTRLNSYYEEYSA